MHNQCNQLTNKPRMEPNISCPDFSRSPVLIYCRFSPLLVLMSKHGQLSVCLHISLVLFSKLMELF